MPNIGVAKAKKENSRHPKLKRAAWAILLLLVAAVLGLSFIPDPNLELAREKAALETGQPTLDSNAQQIPQVDLEKLTIIHNQIDQTTALETYAAGYGQSNALPIEVLTVSGGTNYYSELASLKERQAVPDIVYFDNLKELLAWQNDLADLSEEPWVHQTDFAAADESGRIIAFPVSIDGYGLIYNLDILTRAGIDPASLNNFTALQAASTTLNKQKKTLGLDGVFAYALSEEKGTAWINSVRHFNAYISGGLSLNNRLVLDKMLEGQVESERLLQYSKLVELMVNQTPPDLLINGSYDDQVRAFAMGKTAFILDTQWLEYTLVQQGVTFGRGFLPLPAYLPDTSGIYGQASGWYAINQNSPYLDQAKQFLRDLQATEAGNRYLIDDVKLVPAFKNLRVEPSSPLAKSLWNWVKAGKLYSDWQSEIPTEFVIHKLVPAYVDFASGNMTVKDFAERLKQGIESLNPDAVPAVPAQTEKKADTSTVVSESEQATPVA